jgi:hypothetical protein
MYGNNYHQTRHNFPVLYYLLESLYYCERYCRTIACVTVNERRILIGPEIVVPN